jgi:hypothetical protein
VKSPACDVIGVFAFKEMERQRETHGPKGTGILFFYVKGEETNGMRYSVYNTWHHFGGGNSVSRTLGQFAQA